MSGLATHLRAVILGTVLALAPAAPQAASPPPVTAPTGEVPHNPARGMTPGEPTTTGSTAIPGWNNPPASWEIASEEPQYATLPGLETNRLIQSQGREWRTLRNGPVTGYGGWLIVAVFAAIMLFYLAKGPIRLKGQPTGRLIQRFNAVERTAHWTLAATFVALALTGCVILFGKYLVLPWLGYTGFSWLTVASKTAHNLIGPLFAISLAVSFLIFVADNRVRAVDLRWLARFGGLFGKREMPPGRFNGGEKAWFWGGLVLLGAIVSATGLVLDFPNWNFGRELVQQANVAHAIAALLFIAASFGHIYIGTIGMQGAYGAMHHGYVDEEWAKEHHSLWYEEMRRKEKS